MKITDTYVNKVSITGDNASMQPFLEACHYPVACTITQTKTYILAQPSDQPDVPLHNDTHSNNNEEKHITPDEKHQDNQHIEPIIQTHFLRNKQWAIQQLRYVRRKRN